MTAASPAGAEGLARRVGVYRFSRAAVMKRSTSLGGQVLARAALAVGHLSPRDCPVFRSWRDSLRGVARHRAQGLARVRLSHCGLKMGQFNSLAYPLASIFATNRAKPSR